MTEGDVGSGRPARAKKPRLQVKNMTSTSESSADLPPTAMLEPENSTPAIPEGAKSNPDNVSSLPRLPRKSPPVNAGRLIVLKIDLALKQGEHSKANMNGSQTTSDRIGAIRRLRALDHVIAHFVVGPERHVTLRPTGANSSGGRPSIRVHIMATPRF